MRQSSETPRRSDTDAGLLIGATAVILVVRLGLWLLPFSRLRQIMASTSKTSSGQHDYDPILVSRVACAVKKVSVFVPKATCLTQAIAVKVLLARRGQTATLRIGVSRDSQGEFIAHAWVESNGAIVIGDEIFTPGRFTSLPVEII